ncbi:MAG: alpha/beta family hydrolase [Dehalococcoidia bacterium]
MSERQTSVDVPGAGAVSVIESVPDHLGGWQFIYAPGAGSNVHNPFGKFACRELTARGVASTRFQFPYQEARKHGPDRPPVLEATWRAVIQELRSPGMRLVIGGRSMGGRIASQIVAAGESVDALALFAYPLHPPGRPDQRRDSHLYAITVPTLFCSGTKDAFASPEELTGVAAIAPNATYHLLEGADHGFSVNKASGHTREDVWGEAVEAMLEWLKVGIAFTG